MPLMGMPPRTGRVVGHRRGQMSAGRPAADEQLRRDRSQNRRHARKDNVSDLADLGDDIGQAHVRRERVADQSDVDPVRTRSVRDEGEHVLVVALPIAAVNEDEQRRLALPPRRNSRDARAGGCRRRTSRRVRGPARTAALRSRPRAISSALSATAAAVVVGGIERGPVHAAVDRSRCVVRMCPPSQAVRFELARGARCGW